MPKESKYRDRILGLFDHHPTLVFQMRDIFKRLPGIEKPVVNYWLKIFANEELIIKPRYGHYQKNPSEKRTIDDIRAEAKRLGEARVFQSEEGFKPTVQPITAGEHPALKSRKLHFFSIIERMKNNSAFSQYDVELLKSEADHLIREPAKELVSK
jgi:hypothetical protein